MEDKNAELKKLIDEILMEIGVEPEPRHWASKHIEGVCKALAEDSKVTVFMDDDCEWDL